MARFTFVLGIWFLAGTCGIIGYQSLTYYFYGNWPQVSVGFLWQTIFGKGFELGSDWVTAFFVWLGRLPLMLLGFALSYMLFLVSDSLRGQVGRRPR